MQSIWQFICDGSQFGIADSKSATPCPVPLVLPASAWRESVFPATPDLIHRYVLIRHIDEPLNRRADDPDLRVERKIHSAPRPANRNLPDGRNFRFAGRSG